LQSENQAPLKATFWADKGRELTPDFPYLAKKALDAADEFVPHAVSGSRWNDLCWLGSLRGFPEEVRDACDKAVSAKAAPSDPNNAMYRDSRAVNSVLRG